MNHKTHTRKYSCASEISSVLISDQCTYPITTEREIKRKRLEFHVVFFLCRLSLLLAKQTMTHSQNRNPNPRNNQKGGLSVL